MLKDKEAMSEKVIEVTGDGPYKLVKLSGITVAERPPDGNEDSQLFYNPREIESFVPEEMARMSHSIRSVGLIEPPLVRIKHRNADGKPICIELIAGERRLRSLMQIVAEDAPCWQEGIHKPEKFSPNDIVLSKGQFGIVLNHADEVVKVEFEDEHGPRQVVVKYDDVFPTLPGSQVYEFVPCKVLNDCSDEAALNYAFQENEHSTPLTTREEIHLVNRLAKMGHGQAKIAEMLGNNVTWVSQTANFKNMLPPNAYERLVKGEMARHVAVKLISFAPENRQEIFDNSVRIEAEETKAKLAAIRQEQMQLELQQEGHELQAEDATIVGDLETAARAKRKASTVSSKVRVAKERKNRIEKDAGVVKQGHIKDAIVATGIAPKKAKMLDRQQIEDFFLKPMSKCIADDVEDDITGRVIDSSTIGFARRAISAICNGETDFHKVYREYMFDNELWDRVAADAGELAVA